MRIKPLSTAVANQIAAGEVIENPASVVKELLENALDAHATAITIDIGFGGLNQIKISDNGVGIFAEDLPLAIAPHATSKLSVLEDLSTLTSMGFRGEALASIASISRLTLSSKPADQDHAMMLHIDGDRPELSPCARSQGTTVDVRDLFYNAPVRRRFLKSERSEFLSIEQVVKRFALSVPEMAIQLKHNGKMVLELPAATQEQSLRVRIQRVMGKAFLETALVVDVERAGMHLTGWISGEAYQRSQNDKQWIYLNQRMVKDKLIQHAFKQAYENRLYPGRYPSCLLYLTIPTEEVDVNVHPTKHEVRFQQPRLVHDFIGSQLTQTLSAAELMIQNTDDTGLVHSGHMELVESFEPATNACGRGSFRGVTLSEEIQSIASDADKNLLWETAELSNPKLFVDTTRDFRKDSPAPMVLKEAWRPRPQAVNWNTGTQRSSRWSFLNQQFGLLTWNNQSYLFHIDSAQQHRCRDILSQASFPLPSRPLLVPVSIECHEEDELYLQQSIPLYLPFGIRLELKDRRVVVHTLPVSMPQLNIKMLLQRMLERSTSDKDISYLLATCQTTDAFQLSHDEKDILGDYIIQQLAQGLSHSWCVCLDIHRCQELMGV